MKHKANSRLHILRTFRYYRQLAILFDSLIVCLIDSLIVCLIVSVITYGIGVWACAYGSKYLSKIAKFNKRAWRYSYTNKDLFIFDLLI